jgi:heat shock protein HtpX
MVGAYGLYTHIRRNEIRSRAMVGLLFGFVLVLAYALALLARATGLHPGGAPGLAGSLRAAAVDLVWIGPLVLAGTLLWLFLAYRCHQALIDHVVGARPVTRAEEPELYRLLETLCIARGVRMPSLRIAEDAALNAYATGLNPEQYAVTVTRGLMQALDAREMRAVLAHELTHIRNDDVRTTVIATVIAGIFAFAAEIVLRGRPEPARGERARGPWAAVLIGTGLVVLVWLLSQLIRFGLSRSREYVADAGAVELTKDPDALVRALLKISGRGDVRSAPSGVMALCVDNPRSGSTDLFATHPAIEDRIAALQRYAGAEPVALQPSPGRL